MTGFVEDNFSTDRAGGGMGDGTGGIASYGRMVQAVKGSHGERQMKVCLLACRRSPPPVRPSS